MDFLSLVPWSKIEDKAKMDKEYFLVEWQMLLHSLGFLCSFLYFIMYKCVCKLILEIVLLKMISMP